MAKLTPKQEKFCQKYIETGNASEAYRQSYDCENMADEAVHTEASKLLNNPKITLRLNELKTEHAKRHNTTVDDLLNELEQIKEQAILDGNLQVAFNVVMGKGKILGLAKQSQVEIELKKLELERLKLDKGIQTAEPVKVVVEVKNARKSDTQ